MKWYTLTDSPLTLHGLAERERGTYFRLPGALMNQLGGRVAELAQNPAGGRVRFQTDSDTLVIRWIVGSLALAHPLMGCVGCSGIDCYVDRVFCGGKSGQYAGFPLETTIHKRPVLQDVTLYLPIYNRLLHLEVGVADGARVEAPSPLELSKPIVFYGSSITQGAAASRPGLTYVAQACRALNADFINLGFAGAAHGEPALAAYIAGLDMSLFVLDYDHNAPSAQALANTHYAFYAAIRKVQPELPILILSRPDCDGDYSDEEVRSNDRRRAVVRATYERALSEGDRNVVFLDGKCLFGEADRDACTVDTCHPNDLGFYRMAQTIVPVLRSMLDSHERR